MAIDETLIEKLGRLDCLGVFLWGSHAKGEADSRSDIDVCLVAGPGRDRTDLLRQAWRSVGDAVDVKVFEDLPIYLQGEIFRAHEVIATRDKPDLYEYLRPYWKRWRDQAKRQQMTEDEARALFSA